MNDIRGGGADAMRRFLGWPVGRRIARRERALRVDRSRGSRETLRRDQIRVYVPTIIFAVPSDPSGVTFTGTPELELRWELR